MKKAAFLDRDGTLIEDTGYLSNPEHISFLPSVFEALKKLKNAGYLLIVVTNQSGVGRGYFDENVLNRIHEEMQKILLKNNAPQLDAIFYCPHAPEANCECRKPASGLFLQAQKKMSIDLNSSVSFGDKISDILAGKSAGCKYNFFISGKNPKPEDQTIIFPTLLDAVNHFLQIEKKKENQT